LVPKSLKELFGKHFQQSTLRKYQAHLTVAPWPPQTSSNIDLFFQPLSKEAAECQRHTNRKNTILL
jgi:hypothetical protein